MPTQQQKIILYSGLGGLLEFYDFIIYALLAPILATLYFPSQNQSAALLVTFATFSAGYLARPLGGIVFGHFGDKYGRKNTFMLTVILMACATFAIGILPSYQSLGIIAAILMVSLRILQGFSVGGEIPGAITYVSEFMPEKRGVATAIIFFFLTNGITVGSLFYYVAATYLSHQQLVLWGWRCLFLVGGMFGMLSFFLRKKMLESPLFTQNNQHHRIPLLAVFRKSGLNVLLASTVTGLGATYITVLYLFLPTYFKKVIHFEPAHFLLVLTLAIFVGSFFAILFGFLSQKVNKLILIAIFAMIGITMPIFIFKSYIAHQYIYSLIFLSCIIIGGIWGVIPVFIAELFPTDIRFSGIAISYNLAFALFGGLAPVISLFLIKLTGKLYAPAYYLIALSSLVLLISLWMIVKQLLSQKRADHYFDHFLEEKVVSYSTSRRELLRSSS